MHFCKQCAYLCVSVVRWVNNRQAKCCNFVMMNLSSMSLSFMSYSFSTLAWF